MPAPTPPPPMASPYATWRIIGGVLGGFVLLTLITFALFGRGIGGGGDCIWSAPVSAWVDANGDGRRDSGEQPLEAVRITINDTKNSYRDVGERTYTDLEGAAKARVWLPGCPDARFEVIADPPAGYAPTTERTVAVAGAGYGERTPIQFGFARLPGVPEPTPYVAGLTCAVEERAAYDLATGADGTVWLATDNAAAAYRPDTGLWQTFPMSMTLSGSSVHLQVGADQTVWISDSLDGAARLQHGRWTLYPDRETLVGASEPSVGTSRDGRVWFVPRSQSNAVIAYDPARGTWQAWFGSRDYRVESIRLFTDGSVWRAGFGFAADYPAPTPTPAGWTVYERHVFSNSEIRDLTPLGGSIGTAKLTPDDTLWVVHANQVSRYAIADDTWQTFEPDVAEPLRMNTMNDIAITASGDVWLAAGSDTALAFRFTPATKEWRSYDSRDGLPRPHTVNHVAVDSTGEVWLGLGWESLLVRCRSRA